MKTLRIHNAIFMVAALASLFSAKTANAYRVYYGPYGGAVVRPAAPYYYYHPYAGSGTYTYTYTAPNGTTKTSTATVNRSTVSSGGVTCTRVLAGWTCN